MKTYSWSEWLKRWETRQVGLAELAARKLGYREELREMLKANDELRREYPLAKWPEGQRAYDNRGEVDG